MWITNLQLDAYIVTRDSCVGSRHFPDGDVTKKPVLTLGKRLASPMKKSHPRAKRARAREMSKELLRLQRSTASPSSSRSVTPTFTPPVQPALIAPIGEQLQQDYHVHELPDSEEVTTPEPQPPCDSAPAGTSSVLVNTALLARIEVLEAEKKQLETKVAGMTRVYFRIEDIKHDDALVRSYSGFVSFFVLNTFFEFLGPVVNKLNYWGARDSRHQRQRSRKLDVCNQLFLTLVKLRLDLKLTDLAFRFGVSKSVVSRYLTTWISFLYHHLKEIEWMPSVQQVSGTLPHGFRTHYPNTFAIIDASEVFVETPSDLFMQSSTWSQYKHHNTAKFLIACTPNGAISYVSPVFVGSISDVELTRVSGFLTKLEDEPGISIMADRGFTIRDMLKQLNIELNLPPFMEGRQQLPAEDVRVGSNPTYTC